MRFQIHLSTAITLMFLAGGLIWANTYKHHYEETHYTQGFPFDYYYHGGLQVSMSWHLAPFEPVPLICDVWIAISILFISAFVIESRLQRRAFVQTLIWVLVELGVSFTVLIVLMIGLHSYIGHSMRK